MSSLASEMGIIPVCESFSFRLNTSRISCIQMKASAAWTAFRWSTR